MKISQRREFLLAIGAVTFACAQAKVTHVVPQAEFAERLRRLEKRAGGRLGVALLDDRGGLVGSYRGEERFLLCSSFKLLLVGAFLERSDRSKEATQLAATVAVRPEDLVSYSPILEKQVGEVLSYADLCDAALRYSDNAAANLLLKDLGGPAQLTSFLRSLGDASTRLDRIEPEINTEVPGDVRDTTTPIAMGKTTHRLVLGDALGISSRKRLTAWLLANTTGNERIRAGVPAGYRVADKTGTGENGPTNDVGILFPPDVAPLVLTIYYVSPRLELTQRNAVVAEATRLVVS